MGGAPTIGWSDFALERYVPGSRHSHYTGTNEALLDLVRANWDRSWAEESDES